MVNCSYFRCKKETVSLKTRTVHAKKKDEFAIHSTLTLYKGHSYLALIHDLQSSLMYPCYLK